MGFVMMTHLYTRGGCGGGGVYLGDMNLERDRWLIKAGVSEGKTIAIDGMEVCIAQDTCNA